ncbi:DNA mismatch repair protein Mlh1 [Pelomyxa schiedti]|nr:DNA mismatch repair protein Mlh1 [Pelomyxa schiedti]
MGIVDRIKEIEAEIARTQRNKATEHHLGMLKAKLARYRTQLIEGTKGPGGAAKGGDGFEVLKAGDARVSLIGFPSVGKSTLLTKLTTTTSAVAAYEFTTLTCIPGVIEYKGANIQLLDTPGIIEGAAGGKGRGRQVIAVARTADVVLMMLDASKGNVQKQILTRELETMGIRLNKPRPNIYFKVKASGGVSFTTTLPLTHLDEDLAKDILHEYKIFHAEVLIRCDATVDEFIDVVEGKRVYMKALYVYNKIDTVGIEELEAIAAQENSVVISCEMGLNLDYLLEVLWQYLDLLRVYTKKRGDPPDFAGPLIMRQGARIQDVCNHIHRGIASNFKYALVWGLSAKHTPQSVGLKHRLEDEDVVQVVTRS